MHHLPAEIICDYGNVDEVHHVVRYLLNRYRSSTSVSDTSGKGTAEIIQKDPA